MNVVVRLHPWVARDSLTDVRPLEGKISLASLHADSPDRVDLVNHRYREVAVN
jgi:hypothetical protein